MIDADVLSFYSGYPIDKIVQQGTVSYTVSSGSPTDIPPYPSSLQSIPNIYAQKSLITASWSIDGINFNSSLTTLNYINGSLGENVPQAFINCGVSASNIYFYLVNNYTSSLTFTINYAVYAIS